MKIATKNLKVSQKIEKHDKKLKSMTKNWKVWQKMKILIKIEKLKIRILVLPNLSSSFKNTII